MTRKLTKDDIPVIRKRLYDGEYCDEVAKAYGVRTIVIINIWLYKTWSKY